MSEQRNEFITAETRERQKLEAQQNELVFNALEHEKVLNTIQEEQQRRLQKALDEGHDAANQLASSAKLAAAHVETKCEQVTSEKTCYDAERIPGRKGQSGTVCEPC